MTGTASALEFLRGQPVITLFLALAGPISNRKHRNYRALVGRGRRHARDADLRHPLTCESR